MEKKTLAIWYKNGNTSYFNDVTNFDENSSFVIRFTYLGRDSGARRNAAFIKDNLAGWAIEVSEIG